MSNLDSDYKNYVSDLAASMQGNQNNSGSDGELTTWISAAENIQSVLPQLTSQPYTPSSDVAAGFRQNQIILGRDGNDILVGLDPVAYNPDSEQPIIDFLVGDGLLPQDLTLRDWSDTFILGDWKQPYYANGGLNDFAVFLDFDPSQDFIQLHGSPEDYQLVQSLTGTEILWQQGTVTDSIALLPFTYGLSLEGNYFQFEGDTPPPGPVLRQSKQFGTDDFDLSDNLVTDSFGNVYVAGGTTGSLGGANAGSRDAWVTKYDSNGNQLSIKQLGSSNSDTPFASATDNQDNFYLTGYTEGNLAGTKQAVYADAWLAKYDSDGDQVWIQQFGSEILNYAFGTDVDNDGNVYLSGAIVGLLQAGDDYWVAKYDSNGNRQWYTQFEAPSNPNAFNESFGLAVDSNSNVYTTGWTNGDLGGENAGGYDVWVAKQDKNGNREWIKQIGTEDYEFSWGIDVDSQGNSYATGWSLGNLGGQNAGSYDAWLAKYDSNGDQVWIKQFGTSGDDEAFGVNVDSDGNIFVTGSTDNNLEGTNAGSFDAWVAKYDSNGDQVWIQQFGTPDREQAFAVTVDNVGDLYVTGVTAGSLGGTNSGSFDPWVAKLDAESGILQDFTGTATLASSF